MAHRVRFTAFAIFLIVIASTTSRAQTEDKSNSLPNPYHWDKTWVPKFDGDRKWGATAGVAVDAKGHIWAFERCGADALGCAGKTVGPIVEMDPSGKVLKSIGGGLFVQPHGLTIDKRGNIWATDASAKDGVGDQVFKLSPEGKVLLTLGKAGVGGTTHDTFNQPTSVAIAPNGDIFVADGHGGPDGHGSGNNRIVKFSPKGRYLMEWGMEGTGPSEFDVPHCMAFSTEGRLIVCDRNNNRLQIFDQNGHFIAIWKQFSRPSGIFIDSKDTLYIVDSESKQATSGHASHPGWKRGIRIGSAKTGEVRYFVPDPEPTPEVKNSSGAEGIAADAEGNIYAFGAVQLQTLVAQKKWVKNN